VTSLSKAICLSYLLQCI